LLSIIGARMAYVSRMARAGGAFTGVAAQELKIAHRVLMGFRQTRSTGRWRTCLHAVLKEFC
jgi:hypothetical protein